MGRDTSPESALQAVREINAGLIKTLDRVVRERDKLREGLALLASEEPPEGLILRTKIHSSIPNATAAAWRWFREQFFHRPYP